MKLQPVHLLIGACLTTLLCILTPAAAEEPSELDAETVVLTLYVDANHGDDGADGRAPASALRTLNAAQDVIDTTRPDGRIVLRLARNSVWREDFDYETKDRKRYPPDSFGRNNLTIEAYGEGDLPTLSGLDPLPNELFRPADPEKYPQVWVQTVEPPPSYFIRYIDKNGTHPGLLVDDVLFAPVWTPLPEEAKMRDFPLALEGIETEADALSFVNDNPGSFFPRDNGDGTFDYFVNSGTPPPTDGRTYQYKVRGGMFRALPGNRWQHLRHIGMSRRDGVGGKPALLREVEFLYGTVHNMLISEGRFEDVLSSGSPDTIPGFRNFGTTGSAFHTHGSDSRGIVYDRCIARHVGIAFFDHKADANRPVAILRDCETENVRTFFSHGACTERSYVIGHRHSGLDGGTYGQLGHMALENYMEDSIFRLSDRGAWHPNAKHLHVRNSVLYHTSSSPMPLFLGRDFDYTYENVTLILDLGGQDYDGKRGLASWSSAASRDGDQPLGRLVFRNSVIAVINAPNLKTGADAAGDALQWFSWDNVSAEVTLENCVLTFVEGIPEQTGEPGAAYVFATAEEIFAGDPAKGDYRIREDGPAGQRDAGYREGRAPVFRPLADAAAAALPF